jgi:hypothetical protein
VLPTHLGPQWNSGRGFARADAESGVWKTPAGTDAPLRGANLMVKITDLENGALRVA